MTARKGPFIEEKSVDSLEISPHLDPVAWALSGKMNAMKNHVYCNCGLATMSGDVNVRFIVLLGPVDRTQGAVY